MSYVYRFTDGHFRLFLYFLLLCFSIVFFSFLLPYSSLSIVLVHYLLRFTLLLSIITPTLSISLFLLPFHILYTSLSSLPMPPSITVFYVCLVFSFSDSLFLLYVSLFSSFHFSFIVSLPRVSLILLSLSTSPLPTFFSVSIFFLLCCLSLSPPLLVSYSVYISSLLLLCPSPPPPLLRLLFGLSSSSVSFPSPLLLSTHNTKTGGAVRARPHARTHTSARCQVGKATVRICVCVLFACA